MMKQHGKQRFLPVLILVAVAISGRIPAVAAEITSEALLDTLQHTAFNYFWNEANPANGLVKDRSTSNSPCSIAAVGFSLSAIVVGIDHGWVTRTDGRARVLTTLNTFWTGPQGTGPSGFIGYKGLFYHFLGMGSATRAGNCELSTIDTALLLAGVIDVGGYFDTNDPLDIQVRALADSLSRRADWEFMRNSGVGIRMGWTPEGGFNNFGTWVGYNEAMILYILAIGSPTHPVPASTWFTWTSGYRFETHYGQSYVIFPPLFGHQYSHCWIDYRNIQDVYMQNRGITYFENSRRATLAQRAYCIANPGGFVGYGPNVWGITASDTPTGYRARGAPPPQDDDGTIAPTAIGGSVPFAPEVAISALQHLFDTYQAQLWSTYGFRDAFNLTVNWWGPDYLGIDEGPIILMIENYRNGSIWARVRGNAQIALGLERAGFEPVVGVGDPPPSPVAARLTVFPNAPNPFRGVTRVPYRTTASGRVVLSLYDVSGHRVRMLVDGVQPAGSHEAILDGSGLPGGVYYYELESGGLRDGGRCVVVR